MVDCRFDVKSLRAASDNYKTLFEAAVSGDKEKIKDLLDRELVRIYWRSPDKELNILQVAAYNGHHHLVDFLCERYSYLITRSDFNGLTLLCTAVSKNYLEVVKVLLNHGANPEGSFRKALDHQHKSMALLLAKYGTLSDICLSSCSDSKFLDEFFNMLVSSMPNVNVNAMVAPKILFSKFGYTTLLHLAVENGKKNVMKKLIALGANVNAKSGKELTPLHCAIFKKDADIVECLLNNGANVNCVTHSGDTALIIATKEASRLNTDDPDSNKKFADFARITKLLSENGASVNSRCGSGRTPLHYAAGIDQFGLQIVKLLLDHGADVNAVDKQDATPVFYAENEATLEMLIERGANVNYISKTLFTPLSQMLTLNRPSCVEVLLRNGADANMQNSKGKTILETKLENHNRSMARYDNFEIFEGLINHTSDVNSVIRHFVQSYRSPEMIEALAAMIVKRKVAKEISIDVENLKTFDIYQYLCTIIPMCEIEIVRKVGIYDLTVFDILDMPINKLSNYVENQELLALESDSTRVDFYAEMLKRHIEKARNRRSLIYLSSEAFQKLILHFLEVYLPDIVLRTIVRMLSTNDLTNLAQV